MSVQAVAFDLDDTLLRDDRTVSVRTVKVLRALAEKGVLILPASGRARRSMEGYVHTIGCASAFIACNGAEVWDARGECLLQEALSHDDALKVIRFLEQHGVYFHTYWEDGFYYSSYAEAAGTYAISSALSGHLCADLPGFLQSHPTAKILCIDDPVVITRMRESAPEVFGDSVSVSTSKPNFLEITPSGTSKGKALAFLAEHLGFSLAQTLAFGDSLNDLSMLRACGTSVAMGNARCEVQAVCTFVAKTNNEDGVADFLETHVLS